MSGDAKVALRDLVRRARAQRPAVEQARRAKLLAEVALGTEPVRAACARGRWVTAYAAMPGEPGTGPLLDHLIAAGAQVALPIVRSGGVLAWGRYAGPASLTPGPRGIPEPAANLAEDADALAALDPALLLIPATAVGVDGSRLGQGGGFYDRLLTGLRRHADGGPWRIALVHDDEVMATVPHEAHDERMDAIVTPSRFIIV